MAVIGAIVALSVLIIVHEAGHYIVAKWCKMRVERFSLGFGPSVFGRVYKGTLFQVAPIPFGGFVEIRGMNLVEDVDPEDDSAYPNRPPWQRFLTIFAGPATNYLFASLLVFLVFAVAGMATDSSRLVISAIAPGFHADGVLEVGDRLISLQRLRDPEPIEIYNSTGLSGLVHESAGEPITLVIERGGKRLTVEMSATPDPDNTFGDEPQYRLGIAPRAEPSDVGLLTAASYAVYYPVGFTEIIIKGWYDIITGELEPEVRGPVGIAEETTKVIDSGWINTFVFVAALNIYIGLFNLLPLPALDGGRLVFLVYEMATRRRANPKIESTVHMVGLMLLLLLMVLVTAKDCSRLISG